MLSWGGGGEARNASPRRAENLGSSTKGMALACPVRERKVEIQNEEVPWGFA